MNQSTRDLIERCTDTSVTYQGIITVPSSRLRPDQRAAVCGIIGRHISALQVQLDMMLPGMCDVALNVGMSSAGKVRVDIAGGIDG